MAEVIPVPTPDWLNKCFVEESLKQGLNNQELQITEYNIRPAVATGDNYVSQMFRIKLKVNNSKNKTGTMSIIIKCLPTGERVINAVHEARLFTIETSMLATTMPLCEDILNKIGVDSKLGARILFHQGPPNDLMIMEDLCEGGFKLGDRFNGLDEQHSMLVVKSLARLHASAFVLIQKEPRVVNDYLDAYWSERNWRLFKKLISGGMKTLKVLIQTWNYPQHYIDKLGKLESSLEQKMFKSYERKDGYKLNTIIHGDTWTNNMMFRYDDNKMVKDMVFVDLQFANYNSPVLDLIYFIFTSIQNDIRLEILENLLRTYHETFMDVVNRANHGVNVTFEEFKQEFNNRLVFGVFVGFCIYPIICAPPEMTCDINDLFDLNTAYNNQDVYQNRAVHQVVKNLLPFFDQHHVL